MTTLLATHSQFGESHHAMKFFIDTADIQEIRDLEASGMLDGVTTNPTLVAKAGRPFVKLIEEICSVIHGPVSAEVAATDYETMLAEGRYLARIARNVAVKVPLTTAGLRVCRELSGAGTMVNVTLCFSANQAILAAKAGATFVSPFVGRLDDIGHPGMELIGDIVDIYRQYPAFTTEVLVASIRNPLQVAAAARLGAGVVTLPPSVLRQLVEHPLTEKGLAAFVADWEKTGQKILPDGHPAGQTGGKSDTKSDRK